VNSLRIVRRSINH
jgi:hypothetical protein